MLLQPGLAAAREHGPVVLRAPEKVIETKLSRPNSRVVESRMFLTTQSRSASNSEFKSYPYLENQWLVIMRYFPSIRGHFAGTVWYSGLLFWFVSYGSQV